MRDRFLSMLIVVVLAILSLTGAFLLFKFLESQAMVKGTWFEAGWPIAGFIIIYWLLDKSYRRIAQPSLTGSQTLDLIHLFQETCKAIFLKQMFMWIDELEAGEQIPSLEERRCLLDGIRHGPRKYVTGFSTPFPDLNKHMEGKTESPAYKDAIAEAMRIVDSKQAPYLKRKHLWNLADSAKNKIFNTYVHDLRELKAV